MPYHIFINQESGNDNISIFYEESTFVVISNKDDFPALQLIEESQKPGIYILLGDEKRYVGQASHSILSRIQQHKTNKPWWNKLIFFGREDGHLSKAQLDLLERIIIEKMKDANIDLDNNTQGNKSYIDKLSKFSSLSLLNKVEKLLNDIANIDLFDSERIQYDISTDNTTLSSDISIVFGTSLYNGKSYRNIFTQLVSNLVTSADFDKLISLISPNEPNTVQIIGTREHISPKGTKLTKPVESTKYHIYVNFSKSGLYKQIKKLAELTGEKVIFERW